MDSVLRAVAARWRALWLVSDLLQNEGSLFHDSLWPSTHPGTSSADPGSSWLCSWHVTLTTTPTPPPSPALISHKLSSSCLSHIQADPHLGFSSSRPLGALQQMNLHLPPPWRRQELGVGKKESERAEKLFRSESACKLGRKAERARARPDVRGLSALPCRQASTGQICLLWPHSWC